MEAARAFDVPGYLKMRRGFFHAPSLFIRLLDVCFLSRWQKSNHVYLQVDFCIVAAVTNALRGQSFIFRSLQHVASRKRAFALAAWMHRALFSVLRPTPARRAKRERQHPNGLGGMREA